MAKDMGEYSIVIVEDDERQAAELAERIAAFPDGVPGQPHIVSPQDFPRYCLDNPSVDILFMDVQFEGVAINGIELVKRCVSTSYPTQVVYVTGFAEYATPAYETKHTYFLLKPVLQEALDRALGTAINNLDQELSRPLAFRTIGSVKRLLPIQIHYIESKRRKVLIHTQDEAHESYATLAELSALLPHDFLQCHKSFLVNLAHVNEITGEALVMEDGTAIPVAQKRRREVRERFLEYLDGRVCL